VTQASVSSKPDQSTQADGLPEMCLHGKQQNSVVAKIDGSRSFFGVTMRRLVVCYLGVPFRSYAPAQIEKGIIYRRVNLRSK